MSIGQLGVIPAGSGSLRFLAAGPILVFFTGHSLPLQALGNGPNSSEIYGANISAYAGQYGQLLFQTGRGGNVLDDISFSTQAIPEPSVLSILSLSAVILPLWRRWRRATWAMVRTGGCPPGELHCPRLEFPSNAILSSRRRSIRCQVTL